MVPAHLDFERFGGGTLRALDHTIITASKAPLWRIGIASIFSTEIAAGRPINSVHMDMVPGLHPVLQRRGSVSSDACMIDAHIIAVTVLLFP